MAMRRIKVLKTANEARRRARGEGIEI